MNNNTKAITGLSVIGGLFVLFKLLHFVHTIYTVTEPDDNEIKVMPVTIITTDSSGKKDTMKMEDYLRQSKIIDTTGKY
jgi:hypothetical protein